MESVKLITRKGVFDTAGPTYNQCRDINWKDYSYKIICAFKNVHDENGWLIDHKDMDDVIQQAIIQGSCEEMHDQISKALRKLFIDLDTPIICFKVIVLAGKNPDAYMTSVWYENKSDLIYLTM